MHIWTVNDKKETKFLRQKTVDFDFKKFSKVEIRELVKAMRQFMRRADGIGLSANQIGLNLNVFVAQVDNKFYAIFNPKLVQISKESEEFDEGCLSVPGVYGMVARPSRVTLTGFNQAGKPVKIKAWGLLARVFQHEFGHLNGGLFTDIAKKVEKVAIPKITN